MYRRVIKNLPKTFYHLSLSAASLLSLIACESGNNSSGDTDQPVEEAQHLFLNDTGITLYTQDFRLRLPDDPKPIALSISMDTNAPSQDADNGKDVSTSVSDLDGIAGFQFIKLDENGNALEDQSADYGTQPWHCVKDNVTGRIWEVKTNTGIRRAQYSYTWFNPDELSNGGNAGDSTGSGKCEDSVPFCNSLEYINAINQLNGEAGLCGLSEWRLPTREELRSIIDYSTMEGPLIDTNFFPNAVATDTWTSQTAIYDDLSGGEAWEVHFDNGRSESHSKDAQSVVIRLIHDSTE